MDTPIRAQKSNKTLWIVIIVLIVIIGAAVVAYLMINRSNNSENENSLFNNINSDQSVNESATTNQNAAPNKNTNLNINVEPVNSNANNIENANTTKSITADGVNSIRPPRDETVVTASSTLLDTAGTGFDYSPSQVIDQDFSTAWVEAADGDGIDEWIKMQFSAPAQINTLGIVPGYAQNTTTYQQNNRIKSFELEFSDGSTITRELTDEYGMHFIEFPTKDTNYIIITILDIYPGTKYTDSPAAELDIWSDYVLNKDAAAALAFYEKYKKPAEAQPAVKYISKLYMAIGIMGTPTPEIPVTFYSPMINPLIAAAEIPATTPSGITFTVKWYNEGHLYKTQNITNYQAYPGIDTITISSASYISDLSGPTATAWPLGDFKVEWYENDLLSNSLLFAVTPE